MTAGTSSSPGVDGVHSRTWQRGVAWLLFLGPFFFLSYGFANWWAGTHASPGTLVYPWERQIPFLPWTILPYWSIDLLYGLSFLLCRNRREVDRHALRLLTAQLVAITCFIVFPLRFSFAHPPAEGIFGVFFDALAGFDQPFNQAPSLHIALLVILWVRYAAACSGFLRLVVHAWAILIGISVLTTFQHHFIDVPTGALLGALCLWLWPDHGQTPFAAWRFTSEPARRRLGAYYLLGATLCAASASRGGLLLWMLWPATSLLLVALAYFGLGADVFQKREGKLSVGSRWLLAPYIVAAWMNSRLWTCRSHQPDAIMDDVWLGRMPSRNEMRKNGFAGLCDLTAELPSPLGDWKTASLPCLDLVPADGAHLRRAAEYIEFSRRNGKLLVCCALGYSRGASAVAAWLLLSGRAATVEEACAMIASRRPRVVMGAAQQAALRAALADGMIVDRSLDPTSNPQTSHAAEVGPEWVKAQSGD